MNVIPVSVAVKDFCLNVIKKRTIKSCIVSKKYNTSDKIIIISIDIKYRSKYFTVVDCKNFIVSD